METYTVLDERNPRYTVERQDWENNIENDMYIYIDENHFVYHHINSPIIHSLSSGGCFTGTFIVIGHGKKRQWKVVVHVRNTLNYKLKLEDIEM